MGKHKRTTVESPREPSVDNELDVPSMLGMAIVAARTRRNQSQDEVGEGIGTSGTMIGRYERVEDIPSPGAIVRLANRFGVDPRKWLLYGEIQRAAKASEGDPKEVIAVLRGMLADVDEKENKNLTPDGLPGIFSLTDFPKAFSPLCVIVGDRREEKPQNLGDLFAFTASCVDDRWLPSLRLPRGTEKITDKVFLFQEPEAAEWRRRTFGNTHLLIIGSPAANIAARELNRSFIHRFAIPLEAEKLWKDIKEKEFPNLRSPAALEHFEETHRYFMRALMRKFQQPGFVAYDPEGTEDANVISVVASVITGKQQDFATLTIGKNPFAKKGDRFFSILAGGVHHPGTAWALKALSEPKRFEKHPFGGVLEVHFPSKHHDPDRVKWYESVGLGDATWHTVGQSDLSYDPESLRKAIKTGLDTKIMTDAPVDAAELTDHLELIDLLTRRS